MYISFVKQNLSFSEVWLLGFGSIGGFSGNPTDACPDTQNANYKHRKENRPNGWIGKKPTQEAVGNFSTFSQDPYPSGKGDRRRKQLNNPENQSNSISFQPYSKCGKAEEKHCHKSKGNH